MVILIKMYSNRIVKKTLFRKVHTFQTRKNTKYRFQTRQPKPEIFKPVSTPSIYSIGNTLREIIYCNF